MTTEITPKDLTRFWSKVSKTNNCWVWLAGKTDQGYGRFRLHGKYIYPHRFVYELMKGEIPKDFIIDHLCRNPSCVNPEHLETVTIKDNVLRGVGVSAIASRRNHCSNGHEYTPENTYLDNNRRICRKCRNAKQKRYMEKKNCQKN